MTDTPVPAASERKPLYYVQNGMIHKRPVCTKRDEKGRHFSLGFPVCKPSEYIDADQLCGFFNEAEQPNPDEPSHD